MQCLPHSIDYCNITLLIATFYVQMRSHFFLQYVILLMCSHVLCTVVLTEDGQVG